MSAYGVQRESRPTRTEESAPFMMIAGVVLLFMAAVLMYIVVFAPQPETGMGAIRAVLVGLGGSLAFLLPVLIAWAGVTCMRTAHGAEIAAKTVLLDALTALAIFAAVHVFFADKIRVERMIVMTFSNFISKSYGYGVGGGAIGALLAWPLYSWFGVVIGFACIVMIIFVCLLANGRLYQFYNWAMDTADVLRDKKSAAPQRRPQPVQPRRRPHRDPHGEEMYGGRPANDPRRQRPARPNNAPRRNPARPDGASTDPRPRRAPAAAADNPAPRPRREASMAGPTRRPRPDGQAPAPRRKKLYNETVAQTPQAQPANNPRPARPEPKVEARPVPPRPEARPENKTEPKPVSPRTETRPGQKNEQRPVPPRQETRPDQKNAPQTEAPVIDRDDFDDFDIPAGLTAERVLNPAPQRERAFQPDRPSTFEDRREKTAPPEIMADASLRIEPEPYEAEDDEDDDAPFDMPDKPKAKEALPKIKQSEMKVTFDEDAPEYSYPPIDLLAPGDVEDISLHEQNDQEKAGLLLETLQSFGIEARLTGIAHGPAVTRFELAPAPGIKVSRITSLSDDIALNLAAMSVRIEAPIPGKAAVGVEIPNDKVEMVRLRDVLESNEARKHPSRIAVGLGKDNSGRYIVADIAKMPHVLIAGQTGSGKSVCINAFIASILFRASPEEVRLILIDPKVVELSIYNDIPHLVCPVVTDPKKAASALDWAVAEMTRRYKLFAERGVRDIKGYNKSLAADEKLLPQMVIIIDELADLMMVSPGEVEDSICRLAQLARACGMHLVIATQRPSVNVITGIIKANIPTRIAFSVASQVDSRTMIDHGGAEKLLGNGDMLFVPNGMKSMRVQGAWVSDDEVHAIVEYIKQNGEVTYDPDMLEHLENAGRSDAEKEEYSEEYDPRLPEAIDIVLELGQASISMLQRRMRIGYARAGRLIDSMAQRGIVSEADGAKPRIVLMTREQINALLEDANG